MIKTNLTNKQFEIEYYEHLKECYEVRLYYVVDKKRFACEYEENEHTLLKLKTLNMVQQMTMKLKYLYQEYQKMFNELIGSELILENKKMTK